MVAIKPLTVALVPAVACPILTLRVRKARERNTEWLLVRAVEHCLWPGNTEVCTHAQPRFFCPSLCTLF